MRLLGEFLKRQQRRAAVEAVVEHGGSGGPRDRWKEA
jgi:hypothetical protein